MKFKIKKENILQGLSKVQGITGKRTNIPITSNVLISAKDTYLLILATDLEIAFQGSYEADIINEGSCAIPCRKFYEIIRDFPSKLVDVNELENKWIRISDKNLEYNIVGIETADFPGIPDVEGIDLFEIEVAVLRDMIEKTVYAMAAEEGRAQLAGVFFQILMEDDKGKLRMVSTDGHRLSKIDQFVEEVKDIPVKEEGVIIPKGGIVEVLRLLEGGEKVSIGFKDNNLIVKKDNEGLIIRLIEGDFPDYELIIPKGNKVEIKVVKEELLMTLKRMSILCSERYRSVRWRIDNKEMEIAITNPEIGESREVIGVDYHGERVEVAFNPRYFIHAISSMKSSEVVVKLSDEATPCVVEGNDDTGFLSVIMPMRI